MKLYLTGHDYKYAAEQIMMALLPARPEYSPDPPRSGDDWASVTLKRDVGMVSAVTELVYGGRVSEGQAEVSRSLCVDALSTAREEQKIIKLSFFRAALPLLPEKPVWGALTGIRPGVLARRLLEAGAEDRDVIETFTGEYLVREDRARLCLETAHASLRVRRALDMSDIALYIGIPFCPTRCAYCSFVSQSVEKSMALIPPFLDALEREIRAMGELACKLQLRVIAVYIGGGTPTSLSAEQLSRILAALENSFDLSGCREFTVEAGRPDTITAEKLLSLKGLATRVSINPQSMSDRVLRAIGRRHTAEDIRTAFALAREILSTDINMDIIAGLPQDTPETFGRTVEELIGLCPENITVHTLALKRGTRITLEDTERPGKIEVERMLDSASALLRRAGYTPYYLYRQKFMSGGFENVGWAKPGHESLYNILIMEELCTILAMGAGGSTKLVDLERGRIRRIFNPKYPREYIEELDRVMGAKSDAAVRFHAEKCDMEEDHDVQSDRA